MRVWGQGFKVGALWLRVWGWDSGLGLRFGLGVSSGAGVSSTAGGWESGLRVWGLF